MKAVHICVVGRSGKRHFPDMGYMKGLSPDVGLCGLVEIFLIKKSDNRPPRKW